MDFKPAGEQEAIRDAIAAICHRFGGDYWLKRDRESGFPEDFYAAQAIRYPLARNWMQLEAACEYDSALPRGAAANAAKYLAGEAGFDACQQAAATHGGFGYAKEFHAERYPREAAIPGIAPVSPQLVLCLIAGKVLGPLKSY